MKMGHLHLHLRRTVFESGKAKSSHHMRYNFTDEGEKRHLQLHLRGTIFESEKAKPGQHMRWKRDSCSCTSRGTILHMRWKRDTCSCASRGTVFESEKAKSGQHMGWIRDTCSCCPYGTFYLRARSLPSDLYTRPAAGLTCSCTSRGTVFESEKAKSGQHSGEETPAAAPPMVRFSRAKKLNQVNIVEKRHLQLRLPWYGFRERKSEIRST